MGDVDALVKKLDVEPVLPEQLINDLSKKAGKEVVREIKTRLNQNIFRKIILHIYSNTCCVTGLNIPQLNIASHIVPWSENEKSRLDPTNGLCLSATYDAAFDKNLISLDDKYRIIVSKQIKHFYKNETVDIYFKNFEGRQILLPKKYQPSQSYLANHRAFGEF